MPEASYIKDITLMSFTGLLIYSLLPNGSADFIHRMLIGRDTQKNRMAVNAMALVSGLSILMVLIISGIALVTYFKIQGMQPESLLLITKDSYSFSNVFQDTRHAILHQ